MYRLLIADDEESIREGVADFVRQNCPEWDVAALARDGREALALAREILPDAVLTDITMPHMNGLEFLESLSDLLPEAKLLVLSGYDQFEYAVQALRLGVSDYLLKPLDTAKLVSALSRFAAELDAQALRWAQIETLRTNTRKPTSWNCRAISVLRCWEKSCLLSLRQTPCLRKRGQAIAAYCATAWTHSALF
ncbi:MAG: response regulator [Ruthenibacterium lactatiformans]